MGYSDKNCLNESLTFSAFHFFGHKFPSLDKILSKLSGMKLVKL